METVLINGHNQFVFSDEEKEEIKKLFVDDGVSVRKLMKKFGCSQKPINRVLTELGIDHSRGNLTSFKYNYINGIYDEREELNVKKMISEIPISEQKYSIDCYYFDDLRDPEVIYTIGFLYADGYNNDSSVILSLEEGDVEILNTINNNLRNEKKVQFEDKSNKHDFGYTYKNQYKLVMLNKRISKVLSILGVVRNKSLILTFPKWLHPSMYPHFIRGVYDGDGSLYRYFDKNNKPRNTTVTITSTEEFCKAIIDICAKYVGIKSNNYDASCHNGITRVFSITGYNVCKKFLDWIYKDSTIHLDRKYNRYCDYYNIEKSTIE